MKNLHAIVSLVFVAVAVAACSEPQQLMPVSGINITQAPERICSGGDNNTCKYMVFTENETFENTDSKTFKKYNSSDLYAQIKVGSTCDFNVIGERNPKRSTYRNIITANCKPTK